MRLSKQELSKQGFKPLELEECFSSFMADKGTCSCDLTENDGWQCYMRNGGICRVYAMDSKACRVVLIPEIAVDEEDKVYFRFEHSHEHQCDPEKCHLFKIDSLEK